jgi:hypothetical protein
VREILDRLTAGQQRGKYNPPLGKPLQSRQQPRTQQGGLATPGRPDDGDETASTIPQRRLKQLDQPGNLPITPEEHGGIPLIERLEPRIRRTGRVPREGVGWIESSTAQSGPQPGEGGLFLGKVYPLNIGEQFQPCIALEPKREDRPA